MAAPEMSESLIKAASALGMGSLKQSALRQVGSQLILQRARYQAALSVACKSGAPLVQREATIKVRDDKTLQPFMQSPAPGSRFKALAKQTWHRRTPFLKEIL